MKNPNNILNILSIHNSTGSRLYRILPMAKFAQQRGCNVKVRGLKTGKTGGIPDYELQWADIVVVEMVYSPAFIKACHKAGAKIVYEIDDLMERVSPSHPAHTDMNWKRTYLTYKCLRMADAVTVTTQKLKDTYKWFNQNIYVLPNYLDLPFWEKKHRANDSDKIRLLWTGGNSHKDDLMFIAPVIKRILNKYKNVKFVCCGYGGTASSNEWVHYNYGERLFDVPSEQYEFSLGVPMEVWSDKLASLRGDIGIAPVVHTKFNLHKSNCKSLEYGINYIPGVYSEFLYKDSVIDGKTGFLAKEDPEEWFEKICYLIEHEKERKEMGENAHKHIKENFAYELYGHKWMEVYNKVIA